ASGWAAHRTAGVSLQHLLDCPGTDVLSAADEHVVLPADKEAEPVPGAGGPAPAPGQAVASSPDRDRWGCGARSGAGRPKRCCSAIRAACHPLIPCTPGPGGVDCEHRYTPGMPAAYGLVLSRGRATIPHAVSAPAAMSPAT